MFLQSNDPLTVKASKRCSKCKQVLPFSSFHRNRTNKDGFRYDCKECHGKLVLEWQRKNPEKFNARQKRWREANREQRRNAKQRWRINNPDKARAGLARRRATKRQATPAWASQLEIQKHYAHAAYLEKLLPDCEFQVDHIFPLKSDFVCGLHVENNLIVMEASQNASKGNKWWPDQLPCQSGQGRSHAWWRELKEKEHLCSW